MPTMDWSAAESGMDAVLGAMQQYHQRHLAYDQQMQMAQALSRLGYGPNGITSTTDETGKAVKGIEPIVNPKALEMFTAKTASDRDKMIGGLQALNRLGINLVGTAVNAKIRQQIGETGLAGDVKRAQIGASQSRQQLSQARTAQVLGLLPKPVNPPTGGQLIAEQRAQRNVLMKQQKDISDRLLLEKVGNQNLTDPNLVLDDNVVRYGQSSMGKWQDMNPDKATTVRLQGSADDGGDIDIPIKKFQRVRAQAEKWKALGQQVNDLQASHGTFNQTWGSLTPQQQQVATQRLLNNPTPQMKALFDQRFNAPGSADMLINAHGGQSAPAATPAPQEPGMDDTGEEDASGGADQIP